MTGTSDFSPGARLWQTGHFGGEEQSKRSAARIAVGTEYSATCAGPIATTTHSCCVYRPSSPCAVKQMPRRVVSVGSACAKKRMVFSDTRVILAYGAQLLHATSILGASVESYETSIESPTSTGTVPLMSGITTGFLNTCSVSVRTDLLLR